MKKLFQRHYNAIVKRGKITDLTTDEEFRNKIKEEFSELDNEFCKLYDNSEKINQEGIDLIMTVVNYFIFKGVDIEKELLKNILKNEQRAKNI